MNYENLGDVNLTYNLTDIILANTQQEYEAWIAGLNYLVDDTQNSTYSLQTERWDTS